MTKITKRSKQYQENIDKQNFLRKNGINVKVDGTWGPWQQKQYNRLKSSNHQNLFNKIMIGAAISENPSIMTASGWSQNKYGSWKQKRTKESDELAGNLGAISTLAETNPFNAGSQFIIKKAVVPAISKGIQYSNNVVNRYNFAHTQLSKVKEIEKSLAQASLQAGKINGQKYYVQEGALANEVAPNLLAIDGGIIVKPGITTELHINPQVVYAYEGEIPKILYTNPRPGANRMAYSILDKLPKGTVITSSSTARVAPQLIPKQSFGTRVRYYLTGKTPNIQPTTIEGYSTDIMELLSSMGKKGKAIVQPSLTTRMSGVNSLGKSFSKYKKYFPKSNNEFMNFSEMTPEQVSAWNTEVAPLTNTYIDPITRTSPHFTLTTK